MHGEEDRIGFAIDSGAYFVATNGGGKQGNAMPGSAIDPTIGAFRTNAAAAQYSREVALAMYSGKRPYGYAFGGSGGGFRTISGAENIEGVWDGVVPYVIGSPMSIPNVFTVRTYAMRVLEERLPDIADAVDVGSNKNPYLSAWVEKGIAPPADTVYDIKDSQVVVPATAAQRHGIQPAVAVTVNGNQRAEMSVGDRFELVGEITVPPGTGKVVSAQWDLDGKGDFPVAGEINSAGNEKVIVKLSHSYIAPGTYFPTLRVASQREGDMATPYARIQNLGRARVVVSP